MTLLRGSSCRLLWRHFHCHPFLHHCHPPSLPLSPPSLPLSPPSRGSAIATVALSYRGRQPADRPNPAGRPRDPTARGQSPSPLEFR